MNNFRILETRVRVVCQKCEKSNWMFEERDYYPTIEKILPTQITKICRCVYCGKNFKVNVSVEDFEYETEER